jgi:hypothetical protein
VAAGEQPLACAGSLADFEREIGEWFGECEDASGEFDPDGSLLLLDVVGGQLDDAGERLCVEQQQATGEPVAWVELGVVEQGARGLRAERAAGVVAAGWPPLPAPEASASPPCPR